MIAGNAAASYKGCNFFIFPVYRAIALDKSSFGFLANDSKSRLSSSIVLDLVYSRPRCWIVSSNVLSLRRHSWYSVFASPLSRVSSIANQLCSCRYWFRANVFNSDMNVAKHLSGSVSGLKCATRLSMLRRSRVSRSRTNPYGGGSMMGIGTVTVKRSANCVTLLICFFLFNSFCVACVAEFCICAMMGSMSTGSNCCMALAMIKETACCSMI